MSIAYKDERIVCAYGHQGGRVLHDIPSGGKIGPADIGITYDGNDTPEGHYCLECFKVDGSKQLITRYRNGAYSVNTPRGWVGHT